MLRAQDYEKLGSFYLGRVLGPDGAPTETPLLYDAKDLTTHAVCVGMTGSGKTGLCIALLEEAAIDGIPAIAIDPKGDLGNLLLTFPALRPEDFAPWVDPGDAARNGQSPADYARAVAERWRKGLADWGQEPARIRAARCGGDRDLHAGQHGGPPAARCCAPSRRRPPSSRPTPTRCASASRHGRSGSSRCSASTPTRCAAASTCCSRTCSTHAWRAGRSLELAELIRADPVAALRARRRPRSRELLSRAGARRARAAPQQPARLAGLRRLARGRAARRREAPATRAAGKPRLSILSIAHLSDARANVLRHAACSRSSWPGCARSPARESLRALLYMDEVFGYFPPTANPPSKPPMLTLLKQARAYGLGVVLATQNPVDLDYKGLANAGTWFLGRLQTERDKARVLEGLEGASAASGAAFDRGALERTLAGLGARALPDAQRARGRARLLRVALGALVPARAAHARADPSAVRARDSARRCLAPRSGAECAGRGSPDAAGRRAPPARPGHRRAFPRAERARRGLRCAALRAGAAGHGQRALRERRGGTGQLANARPACASDGGLRVRALGERRAAPRREAHARGSPGAGRALRAASRAGRAPRELCALEPDARDRLAARSPARASRVQGPARSLESRRERGRLPRAAGRAAAREPRSGARAPAQGLGAQARRARGAWAPREGARRARAGPVLLAEARGCGLARRLGAGRALRTQARERDQREPGRERRAQRLARRAPARGRRARRGQRRGHRCAAGPARGGVPSRARAPARCGRRGAARAQRAARGAAQERHRRRPPAARLESPGRLARVRAVGRARVGVRTDESGRAGRQHAAQPPGAARGAVQGGSRGAPAESRGGRGRLDARARRDLLHRDGRAAGPRPGRPLVHAGRPARRRRERLSAGGALRLRHGRREGSGRSGALAAQGSGCGAREGAGEARRDARAGPRRAQGRRRGVALVSGGGRAGRAGRAVGDRAPLRHRARRPGESRRSDALVSQRGAAGQRARPVSGGLPLRHGARREGGRLRSRGLVPARRQRRESRRRAVCARHPLRLGRAAQPARGVQVARDRGESLVSRRAARAPGRPGPARLAPGRAVPLARGGVADASREARRRAPERRHQELQEGSCAAH